MDFYAMVRQYIDQKTTSQWARKYKGCAPISTLAMRTATERMIGKTISMGDFHAFIESCGRCPTNHNINRSLAVVLRAVKFYNK